MIGRLEELDRMVRPSHRCKFPPETWANERMALKIQVGARYRCPECQHAYIRTELGWQRLP